MCNFRVGMKVVLVRDFPWMTVERAKFNGVTLPSVGFVYTVRGIEYASAEGDDYLWLEELHNPIAGDGVEPNFGSHFFRPVVERKTDIEIFRRMLNTTPETVGA